MNVIHLNDSKGFIDISNSRASGCPRFVNKNHINTELLNHQPDNSNSNNNYSQETCMVAIGDSVAKNSCLLR